jgi:hypothetical protein
MTKPGVCFFGSANDSAPASALAAARAFGAAVAQRGWRLVYGGSKRGMMAAAASAAMAGGGEVIGVMPQRLVDRELADRTITQLHVVDTLSERKQMMADLSQAFVAMPGGIGTLDELIEMVSWYDLSIHKKPTFVANLDGFWDPLLAQIAVFRARGMLRPNAGGSLIPVTSVDALVEGLARCLEGSAPA